MAYLDSITAVRGASGAWSPTIGVSATSTETSLPADRVTLSPEARARQEGRAVAGGAEAASGQATLPNGKAPDDKTRRLIAELRSIDARVRAHEAAHQAAAGGLAGAASFTYTTGPDGRRYAVAGEVPISGAGGRTPDEIIANARRVRAAALAPADPSAQDLRVAAAAAQTEMQAEAAKRQQESEKAAAAQEQAASQRAAQARAKAAATA